MEHTFTPETYLDRDRYRQLVAEILRVVRADPLEHVTDLEDAIIWTLAEVGGVMPDSMQPTA